MMIRRLFASVSRSQLHVISKSKTNIKPASPTPSNLKQYNLSAHDQIAMDAYIPMLLFYPSHNTNHSPQANTEKTSNRLKYSLSETLTKYYPFAGRLRSLTHVDCSDEGVDFVEARIGSTLSDAMDKARVKGNEGLGPLFPPGSVWGKLTDKNSSLMTVQLNYFDCGGIALAVNISHKIADACTLGSFVNYWASVSRDSGDLSPPHFVYRLPQSYYDDSIMLMDKATPEKYWITKEFVFHSTKIADLKAAVANQDEHRVENGNFTRVEVLTALLYRCAVAARAGSNSGSVTPSVLVQMANMRPTLVPPLPETAVGNFLSAHYVPIRSESETKLSSLADRVKKGKMELRQIKTMDAKDYLQLLEYVKGNIGYVCSSMCNFLLADQMDFGWGKPIEATFVDTPLANTFILMDTPSGDGIRAMVSLEEQDMETFQCDKELLEFTSSQR